MPKLGEAFVVIRAALKPLRKGLAAARKAVTYAMRKIGRVIKKAMLIGVVAISAAIFAASKFEKQLAMVSTMLDDRTMPIMEEFKKTISGLAREFGQTTQTLSKGLYDILSASIAAEKATAVLRTATKAAIAGMTETEIAADAITTIINAYGINADRAEEISDKLFATVKRGKLTFQDLAGSIGRVAATAAIAGLGFEELLSLIATLTRAGVKPAEAMTSIAGTMRAFLKPTKDATDTAAEFGLVLSSNTLKEIGFIKAVKGLNKASAEQLAMIVPNIRAFKALAAALKDMKGLTYDLNFITNEFEDQSTDAYRKMADTAAFQFARIKETAISAFRALGEPLLGPFKLAMDLVGQGLDSLATWFTKNEEAITKWGNLAVDKMVDLAIYFADLYDIIKTKGWADAFKSLTEEIIRIMKEMWAVLQKDVFPAAVKIGEAMGRGIYAGIEKQMPALAKFLRGAKYVVGVAPTIAQLPTMAKIGKDIAGREVGRKDEKVQNEHTILLKQIATNTKEIGTVGD